LRTESDGQTNSGIHTSINIGYVSINVSDLGRAVDFYTSILGFRMSSRAGKIARLAVDGSPSHIVELTEIGDGEPAKRAGLYHFAVLLPERKFLGGILEHLSKNRGKVHFDGLADHLVSESIYIRDPDNNGIEIYCDRPRSEWKWSGGRVEMDTIKLDTEDLLREAAEWNEMPAGTTIGHVHLHVRDLGKARRFYSEILGLDLTCALPGAYFFAADRYHHHIATNTWLGSGALAAAPEDIGLNHFGLELPTKEAFETAVAHLLRQNADVDAQAGQHAILRDPDGIAMRLYIR
jgi:catechol 2,3-dioxygenase